MEDKLPDKTERSFVIKTDGVNNSFEPKGISVSGALTMLVETIAYKVAKSVCDDCRHNQCQENEAKK